MASNYIADGGGTSPGNLVTQNRIGVGIARPTDPGESLEIYNGNFLGTRANFKFTQEPSPGAPTVAVASGTGLSGTYMYRITFVSANGETEGGAVSLPITLSNQRVSLTNIRTGTSGIVSARRIYRTAANGSFFSLLTTIADNTTTSYTDGAADSTLGSAAPFVNTTGAGVVVGGVNRLQFDQTGNVVIPSSNRVGMTEKVYNVLDYGAVMLRPIVKGASSTAGGSISPAPPYGTLTDSGQFTNVQAGSILNVTNGINSSGTITQFASGGANIVIVTSASHGLSNNERVVIAGTQNYDGEFAIPSSPAVTTNTFPITGTYVSNDATGTWTKTNSGLFDITNVDSSLNFALLNPGQLPTFEGIQTGGVKWQVNACGTLGYVASNGYVLTDCTNTTLRNTFNNVNPGDTLWINSGPNTGIYPIVSIGINGSNQPILTVSVPFRTTQGTITTNAAISWKITQGSPIDNTSAFQAAIDAASSGGGGIVYVPDGYYYFNSPKSIVIRSNVILRGKWDAAHFWRNDLWQAGFMQGPVLLPAGNQGPLSSNPPQPFGGVPFIVLAGDGCSCAIEGLTVYYPNQYLSGTPGGTTFSVLQYPFCIDVQTTCAGPGCDNRVMNMQVVNPYQGIRVESGMAGVAPSHGQGRNHIREVYGSPLFMGISLNNLVDVSYIEKINFQPDFVSNYDWVSSQGLQPAPKDWATFWVQSMTAIQIRHAIFIVLQDFFAFAPHCGIRILQDAVNAKPDTTIFGCNIQIDQADLGLYISLLNSAGLLDVELTNVRITANEIDPIHNSTVNSPVAYSYRKCVYGDPNSSNSPGITGALILTSGSMAVFGGGTDNIIDWRIPNNNVALIVSNIRFDANAGTTTGLLALYGRIHLTGCAFNPTTSFASCFQISSGAAIGSVFANDYGGSSPGTNGAASQATDVFGSLSIGIANPSNPGQLNVYGTPSGGSGDYTNISNPQIKITGANSYWRATHLSSNSSISGVHNYETGKDVYWGESSDTGVYHFRGRNLSIESGAWNGGHIMLGSSHLWVDSIGRLRIKGSAPTSDTDGTVVGTQS